MVLACVLAGACLSGCSGAPLHERIAEFVGERGATRVEAPVPAKEPLLLAEIGRPAPYAYFQLNEDDQEKYRALLEAFQTREARAYPDDDMESLERIRDCVLADYPELFYVTSVHLSTTSNVLTGELTSAAVEGQFAYTPEEADAVLAAANAAAEECFAELPADADDYAKAKRVYEFLAQRVTYDHAAADSRGALGGTADGADASEGAGANGAGSDGAGNVDASMRTPDQNIDGALVGGAAVCGGYASACEYLLQRAGVKCAYVTGVAYSSAATGFGAGAASANASGESHAWCLARLDGEYYFIDPTWGDLQYFDAASELPVDTDAVSYDYLAVTGADLAATHVATSPFELPECSATADNYYVREGLVFDWPDEPRLGAIASVALAEGRAARVRCGDDATFTMLLDNFVATGRLADYLGVNEYHYSSSPTMRSIAIWG